MLGMVGQAKTSINVVTPFLSAPLREALGKAARKVYVRIILSKRDVISIQWLTDSIQRGSLLELRSAGKDLHTNQIVIDERIGIYGSSIYETRRSNIETVVIVALLLSSIEESLKEKSEIEKTKTSELINVKNKIDRKTTELAELKADSKQVNRLSLLKNRLSLNYERQMLAGILTGALESTLQEQKDQRLTPVYRLLSELWQKFRPESQWQIGLDEKGLIKVASDSRQYEFAHLGSN
jgi:hypothetical protein